MPNPILDRARAGFHRLLPEETRTRLYFLAPKSVKKLWDQFGTEHVGVEHVGADQEPEISEKDVLFTARLLWFHEPSPETIQRWYTHATRLNYEYR